MQTSRFAAALARSIAYIWFSLDLITIFTRNIISILKLHTSSAKRARLKQHIRHIITATPRHTLPRLVTTKNASLASIIAILFLTGFAWQKNANLWTPQNTTAPPITAATPEPETQLAVPVWPPSHRHLETESLALMEAWEQEREIRLTLNRGNTLSRLLRDAGVNPEQSEEIIAALSDVFNPRKLRAGQTIVLTPVAGDSSTLKSLRFEPERSRRIEVRRLPDGSHQGARIDKALAVQTHWAEGEIQSSLYLSAVNAGVPLPVLARAIQIFSFSVDFQRDIQPGDRFALFFETWHDELGHQVSAGDLLYGELILRRKELSAWGYAIPPDESLEYYDHDGNSVRKGLMRTPIDGARLSSGFGMRLHPILGYNRMHRGLDFAAPTGTPVYAAGNGTVERAGRNGGYGNYIRIRHGGGYKTAYAHLKGFAKGIKKGARVAQGDVIGYVGSTGRSTGPHLHYEILLGDEQLNPSTLDLPSGQVLAGERLQNFHKAREVTFARIQRARGDAQITALAKCSQPLLRCSHEPE